MKAVQAGSPTCSLPRLTHFYPRPACLRPSRTPTRLVCHPRLPASRWCRYPDKWCLGTWITMAPGWMHDQHLDPETPAAACALACAPACWRPRAPGASRSRPGRRPHRPVHGRARRLHRQRRRPLDPRQPGRLGRGTAARGGRLHHHLRRAAGDRRPARRHPRPPAGVPGRARRVHAGLAGLRAGQHGRAACRPALRPGRGRRGDDPAGAQPDPAHPRGPGPGPRDEPLLRGAGRRRGGRPAGRRPADQREPVRFRLAAGVPGQRARRRGPAGRRRPRAAARPGRARPDPGPARPGPADPGGPRVRPPARARPARALAGLGLDHDGRERAAGRRLRRRRTAGGRGRRRPRWCPAGCCASPACRWRSPPCSPS